MSETPKPSEALERARAMLGKVGTPYDDMTSVLGAALDDMAARVDELERRLAEVEAARASAAADPPSPR